MQTTEIASLFVECAAQTTTSVPVSADGALFGITLTEALETMDRQNLPADTKDSEEVSTDSAEAGNCLALTWNIIPLAAMAAEAPVTMSGPPSTPEGELTPKTDPDTARRLPAPNFKNLSESMTQTFTEPSAEAS